MIYLPVWIEGFRARHPDDVTSILFSLNPMFIAIMAMVALGEPLSHHQWAALLFDIGAVFVLVNPMQMTYNMAYNRDTFKKK